MAGFGGGNRPLESLDSRDIAVHLRRRATDRIAPRCSAVGAGEVRIAVKASGINFADTLARIGLYPDAPKTPCVVGYEVAGEVESVGEGVGSHKVGDRVVTTSGIYGQITKLNEKSIQVQIADKVRIEIARQAVGGYQGQDPVVTDSAGSM